MPNRSRTNAGTSAGGIQSFSFATSQEDAEAALNASNTANAGSNAAAAAEPPAPPAVVVEEEPEFAPLGANVADEGASAEMEGVTLDCPGVVQVEPGNLVTITLGQDPSSSRMAAYHELAMPLVQVRFSADIATIAATATIVATSTIVAIAAFVAILAIAATATITTATTTTTTTTITITTTNITMIGRPPPWLRYGPAPAGYTEGSFQTGYTGALFAG